MVKIKATSVAKLGKNEYVSFYLFNSPESRMLNIKPTFAIKQTFYLQKVKDPKVTLGILFGILNEHSVQGWENN